MTLIETQSYYSWKLPKGWTIVLTTNPDDGEYSVNSLDAAQQSRFFNYELTFNKETWASWAEANKVDGRLINFVLLNSQLLEGTGVGKEKARNKAINPRAVVNFGKVIRYIPDFSSVTGLSQITTRGGASVGPEFTQLFVQFVNNKLDKLPTPEYMLTGNWKDVKKELVDLVGNNKSGDFRGDIASALMMRIINYSLVFAENNTVSQAMTDRLVQLSTEDIFLSDLKYNIVREIFAGNKEKFRKLAGNTSVQKMLVE